MGHLAEKELLLLCNYMYIEGSTETGKSIGDIIDDIIMQLNMISIKIYYRVV